ncbi:general transcription factor II-I repeat domain-containing protein 2B [Trichonephila clavata]|uniref:General transcription factor II-I repeat domain-containing protein 2B n=1 Tax=Trichonephila clavata TaxID=2740835 RepID=A0A8X6L5U2_TRICU|nr:general transcription factor II-I repeat domain-containing protein 2B [Trichonephila clavata]
MNPDATDTVQVAIFIRDIDRDYTVAEELVGAAGGIDLFLSLTQVLVQCVLNFSNISAITADGAKSITGKKIGVITLLTFDVNASGSNI